MKLSTFSVFIFLGFLFIVVVFAYQIFFAKGYYIDACVKAGNTFEQCEFRWIESRQRDVNARHYYHR